MSSLSGISAVTVDDDLAGFGAFLAIGKSKRYALYNDNFFINEGILKNISSAVVWQTSGSDSLLCLFGIVPPGYWVNFRGSYCQITCPSNHSDYVSVNLRTHNFNDISTSAMLIETCRAQPEDRSIPGDYILPLFKFLLNQMLNGTSAGLDGNPQLTWEFNPSGTLTGLDQNEHYMALSQRLIIDARAGWCENRKHR